MASGIAATDWRVRPAILAAASIAILGYAMAAVSTNLALLAGEQPVTLVPYEIVGGGLPVIVIVRGVMVVLLAAAVSHWTPRYLGAFLTGTGLFWVLVGSWQWWLMLART